MPARLQHDRSSRATELASEADVRVDGNGAAVDPRFAAIVPAQLLDPDELVILLLKPSAWFIVLAPLRALTVLAVLTALAVALQRQTQALPIASRDLLLLGIAAIGIRLFWQFLDWLGRVYILTDRRVIRIRGVVRVMNFECPLEHVQHTNLYVSIRERLFGLGTLGFATAGSGVTEAWWVMLSRPMEVQRVVADTIRRYGPKR